MSSIADDLQRRADTFGVRLLIWVRALPRAPVSDTIAKQLARSGGAIAANYRPTRRARSRAEFIARLAVVVEEADESAYWLEQMGNCHIGAGGEFKALLDEATQLLAIFSRSLATAKRNYAIQKASIPRHPHG